MTDPRTSCPEKCKRIHENICNPKIPGVGPLDAKIVLVGEAPGQEEDKRCENFVGASGRLLNSLLQEVGLSREDVRIINAVRCATEGENKKPTKNEIACCRTNLVDEIKEIHPNVIGCLGAVAMESVLKRTGITKLKNNIFVSDEFNAKIIPIYHPAYILRNPGEYDTLLKGMRLIAEESGAKKKIERDKVPTKRLDVATSETIDKVLTKLNNVDAFVFDLETSSLSFLDARILCIALSWKSGLGITIKWDLLHQRHKERLKDIFLSSKLKINHNLKFDLHILKAHGFEVKGPFFDTLIAASLIDENRTEKGLDALTLEYLDLGEYWAGLDEWKTKYCKKNKMKLVEFTYDKYPYPKLAKYAQHDADATFRLYEIFREELEKIGLTEYFNKYSMTTMQLLTEMEHKGVKIDRSLLKDVIIKCKKKERRALEKIHDFKYVKKYEQWKRNNAARSLYYKWDSSKNLKSRYPDEKEYIRSKINKDSNKWTFNEKSYIQLGDVLFKVMKIKPLRISEKSGKPSTDEKVLTELAEKHDVQFVKDILEHRGLSKYISTYLVSTYMKSKADGRIHANYLQHRVVTGRLCVDKDTLISTNCGLVPIHDVSKLLAEDTRVVTHLGTSQKVKCVIVKGIEEMLEYGTSSGNKLICTRKHLLLTKGNYWMSAEGFCQGDIIPTISSIFLENQYKGQEITSIRSVGPREVWDIEVENDHSYIGNGFVCHNSCIQPNLQNIGRDAKDYKKCIVADPGYLLVKGDLKQAEFRCWAHYSNDRDMIKDIEAGLDIHRRTASEVFGISEEEVTDEQRTVAKAATFGTMYGRGAKAVAKQFNIDEDKAKSVQTLFFSRYPKAALWLDQQVEFAKVHKYVRTWLGRYRRLPKIDSDQQHIQAEAEREAKNSPIQGLASNMNDYYMYRTWKLARKKGLECYPAITQHDAQIHLIKEDQVNKLVKIMNYVVDTSFPDFRVKMTLDIEVGKTLGTLEKFNVKK
jgi:uracil-DNA glycosylase family 4